jgi:hypothetical protein
MSIPSELEFYMTPDPIGNAQCWGSITAYSKFPLG